MQSPKFKLALKLIAGGISLFLAVQFAINVTHPPTLVSEELPYKTSVQLVTNQKLVDISALKSRIDQVGYGCDLMGVNQQEYRAYQKKHPFGGNGTSWDDYGSGMSTLVGSTDGWLLDVVSHYHKAVFEGGEPFPAVNPMTVTGFKLGPLEANLHLPADSVDSSDCGPLNEKPRPSDWDYYQRLVGEHALNYQADSEFIRDLMTKTNIHAVTVPWTFWPEQQSEAVKPLLPQDQQLYFIVDEHNKIIGYRVGDYVRDNIIEPVWQPTWTDDLIVLIKGTPLWKTQGALFTPVTKICRLIGAPVPAGAASKHLEDVAPAIEKRREAGLLQEFLPRVEYYSTQSPTGEFVTGFGIGQLRVIDASECGPARLLHASSWNDRWMYQYVVGINSLGLLTSKVESFLLQAGLQTTSTQYVIKEENAERLIPKLRDKYRSQEVVLVTDNQRVLRFEMLSKYWQVPLW